MTNLHRAAALVGGALLLTLAQPADAKSKPGWFSKPLRDVEFRMRPVVERDEIKSLFGSELGEGFIVVEIEVRPLYNSKIEVDRDDFLVRSRKDNERSYAMSPDQIAGESVLVLGTSRAQSSAVFNESRGPVFGGGPAGGRPSRLGNDGGSFGNTTSTGGTTTVKSENREQTSLYDRLRKMELPTGETRKAVRGYLFFQVSSKNKLKHLNLDYDGGAGEFQIEFEDSK